MCENGVAAPRLDHFSYFTAGLRKYRRCAAPFVAKSIVMFNFVIETPVLTQTLKRGTAQRKTAYGVF